jgi:hypothetical protein
MGLANSLARRRLRRLPSRRCAPRRRGPWAAESRKETDMVTRSVGGAWTRRGVLAGSLLAAPGGWWLAAGMHEGRAMDGGRTTVALTLVLALGMTGWAWVLLQLQGQSQRAALALVREAAPDDAVFVGPDGTVVVLAGRRQPGHSHPTRRKGARHKGAGSRGAAGQACGRPGRAPSGPGGTGRGPARRDRTARRSRRGRGHPGPPSRRRHRRPRPGRRRRG